MKKSDIYDQFKEHHAITESGLDLQYEMAERNHMFYSGDEMAYRVSVADKSSRRIVVFNRIKPFVNSITGFMIKLRRKPDYQARQQESTLQKQYTNHTNSFSDYLRSDASLAQIESRQDKEMLITGIGAVDTSISHLKNPYGEVAGEAIRFDEFGYDPQARATNLLDARWAYRRKVMNRDDAADLFAEDPDIFEDAASPLISRSSRNSSYIPTDGGAEEDLVQVFYYQWWTFETYWRIENPLYDANVPDIDKQDLLLIMEQIKADIREDNEEADPQIIEDLFEFNPEAEELVVVGKTRGVLKEIFTEYGIKVEETRHRRKAYYTALVSGKKVIKHFKSQDQNGFTIKFKTGDFDEIRNVWHGMVDQLREPARYANKALTEIMYVIASNSKGGVMYEEDAVSDPKRFEQQYATTDAAIRVNAGALSGGKIQDKARSALPSGYENVLAAAKSGLFETTGVNPEFLGSSENKQVSALLEAQRIEQVVSTLATYFDSITLYGKENGRLMLTYMHVLYENNPSIIFRILGEDGSSAYNAVDEFALFSEYDIDIQEVPTTPVQKAENLRVMTDFAQNLLLGGVNIYSSLVDDLPVKEAQKQRIREALNPEVSPEQQQQQQQQQELTNRKVMQDLKEQLIDISKKVAETEKLGAETFKTTEDTRKTQADTLKTVEEAEQLDLENQHIAQLSRLGDVRLVI
jgi:hypothetical protein